MKSEATISPSRNLKSAPSIGVVPVSLPLRFVITGLVSFLLGLALLILRPDILATYHYHQAVIAVTHLFALGWLCSIVMGALYQLVPVALETNLYGPRIASAHYVCHVVGVAGMIGNEGPSRNSSPLIPLPSDEGMCLA